MGCCVSTTKSTKFAAENLHHENYNSKQDRNLPHSHPVLEEESVKEVLSETPTIPKKAAIFRTHQDNNDTKKLKPILSDMSYNPDGNFKNEGILRKPITIFNSDEVSEEASEICSTLSESVSTVTYCTEKNDDDGADNRQKSFRQRSLSGDSMRERVVGKSPSKRSDPSPGRVRPGSGRDSRGLGNNVQRRDCGESSGRRSRSPATRSDCGGPKTGLVRSGSARKTWKSPGRVKSEMGDKIRKVEEANSNFSSSTRENRDDKWPPTSNESLENPLVSLECFIFL